jgi:hypothetical protein
MGPGSVERFSVSRNAGSPRAKSLELCAVVPVNVRADFGRAALARPQQVFVEIRPIDAETTACERPIGALRSSGFDQAWKPYERNGEGATIGEIDTERELIDSNIEDTFTCGDFGAMGSLVTSTICPAFPGISI